MNTDSGGYAHKSVALSLILSPMKRVQSFPNLATGSDSHSSDLDSWRSSSVTDGLKNGDASSSSLAAKGFRSVKPNLQDKKSPSQDTNHMPPPPPRRESFNFSHPGTNPPAYSSLVALANDLSPGMLQFTQSKNDVVKESYTLKSTSSYAYSTITEQSSPSAPLQHTQQTPTMDDFINCSASTTSNTQERKVSSLKLTPLTIPDPPAHLNSYTNPEPKPTETPLPAPHKDPTPTKLSTQAASLSIDVSADNVSTNNVSADNEKHLERQPSNTTVELNVQDQASKQNISQTEMNKPPPAVPPRPSAAQVLVQN